ncbi:MAG: hypothetical protein WDN45_12425 [Caulobacteraceae bacterium]
MLELPICIRPAISPVPARSCCAEAPLGGVTVRTPAVPEVV